MAVELKKDYQIGWDVYNNYIKEYEEKIKNICDLINKVYLTLNSYIMVQEHWCDDNAKAFATWFKANCNSSDSYEAAYKAIKSVFEQTVKAVCDQLKKTEQESYEKYPYVKKYASQASAWDSLAKYKTTYVSKIFTNITLKNTAKANRASIKTMYGTINSDTKDLKILSEQLGQMVLSFGVGNKGIRMSGLDCPANARLIARLDIFSANMKKQLDACITKTNGLDGIVSVIKK